MADTADTYGGVVAGKNVEGPWKNPRNILAVHGDDFHDGDLPPAPTDERFPRTLSILVVDEPGILNRVSSVLSRRGYNVQSLAVGPAETVGLSRITVVLPASTRAVEKLRSQIVKIIGVEDVSDLSMAPFVYRELSLVKVKCATAQDRAAIKDIAELFRAAVVDAGPSTLTIEVNGREGKMKAVQDLLMPYGILEVARTGRIAIPREYGLDSTYLKRVSAYRVQI